MGSTATGTNWEYHDSREPSEIAWSDLGREGWELVAIGGGPEERLLYLKRPVAEPRCARDDRATKPLLRVTRARSGARRDMKRGGVLNPALSHLLASTGHTDYFTVCDRGFPVPEGPERIDLALVDDIPTVLDVLQP